ncbi:MAG TPA: hypothetical protein VFV41_20035 [Streptosporangiaceae bacterium]|nr:hypothetical protein [Streptosporangiaceae bacterium]
MSISRDWAALASPNERLARPEDTLPGGTMSAIRAAGPRDQKRDHRDSHTGSFRRPSWRRRKAA